MSEGLAKALPDLNMYRTIYGLPEGADALWLADQARQAMRDDKVVTHIALDDGRVDMLAKLLAFIEPDAEILTFPSWDCLPYDRVSPNRSVIGARVKTLCRLIEIKKEQKRRPRILLTTVNAASQKLTPPSFFDQAHFGASKGGRVDIEAMQSFLAGNGYERVQTVRESGEFAIRGGIVDLFPSGWEMPIRMDLFGDEVESIKYFDPVDQRSTEAVEGFSLYPVSEYALDEISIQNFRSGYRELFGLPKSDDPLYSSISEARPYNGAEHWLPLFFKEMATLFDYLGESALSIDAQGPEALGARLSQIEDFYQARQTLAQASKARKKKDNDVSLSGSVYQPIPWKMHYIDEAAWQEITQSYQPQLLSPFRKPDGVEGADFGAKRGRDFVDVRAQNDGDVIGAVSMHIRAQQKQGRQVCLATYSEGSGERLRKMLDAAKAPKVEVIPQFSKLKKLADIDAVGLAVLPLEHGFETDKLCVVSEQDMLGERLSRTQVGKKRKSDQFIREISSLSEGDYVVHVDHGVGQFAGLETLEAGGALHDCLKVLYAGDDRLFVPVEHIEVLSRFGGEDASVNLDKLGGAGWQARKAKVKKDLMAMADNLLQIAAARQLQKADEIRISEGLYEEFASRFPYHETEDQLRAINAAIEDLGKSTPMDRLVCGDVGFGKTEVALRAAYVSAMDGHQVALVVPTTLLARQHTREFERRFAGTGLRIGQLSRMVGAKDAEITKKEMREGTINIVIGTHALFSKNTKFANLGLVIVD